jgi:hypothetical protein
MLTKISKCEACSSLDSESESDNIISTKIGPTLAL